METAEYLDCLIGQVVWGNRSRRNQAAHNLAEAMGARPMSTSLDCFKVKEGEELLKGSNDKGKHHGKVGK